MTQPPGRLRLVIVAAVGLVLAFALIVLAHGMPAFIKNAVPESILNAYYSATNRFAGKLGTEGQWRQLEQSRWVADGAAGAPRVVYVFTDLNCPYCEKFWADARPWVDGGKVQLRHLVVGILSPTSPGKAATLLLEKNPAAALQAFESHRTGLAIAPADPASAAPSDLTPLAVIPPDIQAALDANHALMSASGLGGTPALVWRNARNEVRSRAGAPAPALDEILGPR
jgi:thiol:disulfide interchange protein DsbG